MSEESVGDAGPSNLGYYGGVWSPDGTAIVSHGYTGALHLWVRKGGTSLIWISLSWNRYGSLFEAWETKYLATYCAVLVLCTRVEILP